MKIHEYQAKNILAEFGIPVPRGGVVTTPDEASKIGAQLGGKVVIKAQIHAGGRGKAGGVKIAESPEEAGRLAAELLGKRLVTNQTSPEGLPVNKTLVEEVVEIKRELYLGIVVDSSAGRVVMMASEIGGVEVEEVARENPEKIIRVEIDPLTGFQPFKGRRLAYGINLAKEQIQPSTALMANFYKLFQSKDCSLAEINPLAITADGGFLALDAKINIDDNSLYRHHDIVEMRDYQQEEQLEAEASKYGISYIKLDGDVGCMVNGAGLAMATLDTIALSGAQPANFLDIGGGASEEKTVNAFMLLLSDPKVKMALINVFGGILRCDTVARGITKVASQIEVKMPIVVVMRGTNYEEGKQILAESGLNIIFASDLQDAIQKMVTARKKD